MKIICHNGNNQVVIEFSLQEIYAIRSALVEVLYALDTHDCLTRTGFSMDCFEQLIDEIDENIK